VLYLSRGGGNQPWNLATACAAHHLQGEHAGRARVRGRAPLGLLWRLGEADVGEWFRNDRRLGPRDGAPRTSA
ncbi:MAG TPA: hypothetical protein VJV23_07385, partial [Candidatus Polarisedimenticolia bacterium]|nr:hypothetical protein [Candidatus Polarisedimenticolia bacterium]HKY32339.1 hypothetical protein [Candidatus Polarisedimenticolia bacterium]